MKEMLDVIGFGVMCLQQGVSNDKIIHVFQ